MQELVFIALVVGGSLVATSRSAYRMRRSRLVMGLLAGGWPAVGLGVLVGESVLGLVSAEALRSTTPLMIVGLGWIGMLVGLQLKRRVLAGLPRALVGLSVADVVVCVVVWGLVGGSGVWLWAEWRGGVEIGWGSFAGLFSGVVLVVASGMGWSMETRSQRVTGRSFGGDALAAALRLSGALCGVMAVGVFGVLLPLAARDVEGGASWFDVRGAGLDLLLVLALSLFAGVFGRFTLRLAGRHAGHQLAVFLGLVAFSGGVAAQTGVSPLLASMLTGAVLTNLASVEVDRFMRFIMKAEQPVAVLFAFLAGILASAMIGWGGVLLALLLAGLRLGVKPMLVRVVLMWSGGRVQGEAVPARSTLYGSAVRQSPIAIAMGVGLVVTEWSPVHRELLGVVLLAGVLSEVFPQVVSAGRRTALVSADRAGEGEAGGGVERGGSGEGRLGEA